MTNEQLQQKIQEQLQDLLSDIAFENDKLRKTASGMSVDIGSVGTAKFHRIGQSISRLQSMTETMNNRFQQIQALRELRKV